MESVLEKYIEELKEDTKVDNFNLKDVQMKLPSIKHKWVARLIRAKQELTRLELERRDKKNTLSKKLQEQSPVVLTDAAASRAIEFNHLFVEIDEKIKELKLVIELLDETKKTFSAMTFDIKNIVEIIKLETT